jgi:hypothetical protein
MKYRHERMIRAREARLARRTERQMELEAALRSCLTADESRRWQLFSDAVARVQPYAG